MSAITRQEIVSIVDDIATGQGEVAADRARTALGVFFGWAIERHQLEHNPSMNISRRAERGSRDRVLSEAELVEVWQACGDDDYSRIVKFLILTGQRRREIGDLTWAEIDRVKRQIELPAERTKNHRPHIVPLSDTALSLLPRAQAGRDLVFGRGAGGFSGWSKAKGELDARIAAHRKRSGIGKTMPDWRLHDLRRSFITHANDLGFAQPHVIEAIANHVSGHLAGIAGTYNKAQYLGERRQALERWSTHMVVLVGAKAMSCRSQHAAVYASNERVIQRGARIAFRRLNGDMLLHGHA